MKFQTIRIEGNTISADILEKISEGDYKGQLSKDFGFESGTKVKDEIARAWADAQNLWKIFKSRTADLSDIETGLQEVRKYWMIPFLGLLDYNLETSAAEKLDNGNTYPISHRETKIDRFPVYIVGFKDKEQRAPEERSTLDIKPSNASRRMSPHALAQEYINLTEYAYAIISNGLQIRLLRDSSRLVKLSFLEFDLQQMMEEEVFSDFAVLFRVLHASRLPRTRHETAECLIEQYHLDSIESGARIREGLSEAVERSIRAFSNGFLSHSANQELRNAIVEKRIDAEKYYQYQLRLIYRLLFLMVTEERNLVYPEQHSKKLRDIYYKYYSVERLRRMVDKRFLPDGRHGDHWEGLKHTFQLFEKEKYGGALGIKPLNGELFGINALGILVDCALPNQVLLECMRNLTVFINKDTLQTTRVNYASLNVEEFGSVYEGLLEYDPIFQVTNNKNTSFDFKVGEGRSSSGSHYTPEELVQPLIKHSLEYIIELKLREKNKEDALLSIKICDVACGSGHILLSAARRIAIDLARTRTGEDQPAPGAFRLAIRDVIKHCVYGVDKNPLAVELCKVALWLEAHNPGEPLGFLDHHIKCGDAIVGLANRYELDNGVADEAFKTMPGDDKEIASSYFKKNKSERKERESNGTQLRAEFEASVHGNVQEVIEVYRSFNKLPEHTPQEVEAKQQAYNKFLNGKGYSFLKTMADTQVAQLFIPKIMSNKERFVTDSEFRQVLSGYKSWQSPKTAYATIIGQQENFFHWFIEFPEVFQNGGFDCLIGNPPYLGGLKVSTHFGHTYLNWLFSYYSGVTGTANLVTYFLRRFYHLLNRNGICGLIATTAISQGDTRDGGLKRIVEAGGQIIFAKRSLKWPGAASVTVSLLCLTPVLNLRKFLDGNEVKNISYYLDNDETLTKHPLPLVANQNFSFVGTALHGIGFMLQPSERNELIEIDHLHSRVIKKYMNGRDLNDSPEFTPSRFVIDVSNLGVEKLKKDYPKIHQYLFDRVKPERDKNKRKSYRENWWIFGEKRPQLYASISGLNKVLVRTQASKHNVFAFAENDNIVFDQKLIVFATNDLAIFAFLSSTIHEIWFWKFKADLGETPNYSPSEVFQTFPFFHLQHEFRALNEIASVYYVHRNNLIASLGIGLTKAYNLFHAQYLTSIDIQKQTKQPMDVSEKASFNILKLRELHEKLDQRILSAYGWEDIQLRHGFYEVESLPENDRVRYTIHPDARKEILKRLLDLNHKIHSEEVGGGILTRTNQERGKKAKKPQVPTLQQSLFSDKFDTMVEFDLDTGIYTTLDAAEITGLPIAKVRRWFNELSAASYVGLEGDTNLGVDRLKISFHGLIELVVIGTLRDNKFSLQKIMKAREDLKDRTGSQYPFATENVKKIDAAGSSIIFVSPTGPITLDGTGQYNLEIIKEFFRHIEFNTEGMARKLFPSKGKGNIVVDPKVGEGKPVIKGKSVWAEVIAKMYSGPDSIQLLKEQYDLKEEEILAAVEYCSS